MRLNKEEDWGRKKNARALPLPALKTKSIGHPQLTSTKSTPPEPNSCAMASAAETRTLGRFPASWTPKMDSEGWRRRRDHSSFEPERSGRERATVWAGWWIKMELGAGGYKTYFRRRWCLRLDRRRVFGRAFFLMSKRCIENTERNLRGFLLSSMEPDLCTIN